MANQYDIGRSAALNGAKAPPKADNFVSQQQRDGGFNQARNAPPPPPPPITTNKGKL